jgi:Family of unknown function (DUF5763)
MRVSGIRAQRDDELSLYRGGMRGAMARFLTVNDFSDSPPLRRANEPLHFDPRPAAPEFGVEPANYGVKTPLHNDQGPCVYLGPQGQRCSRPAIANGFCGQHRPAPPARPGAAPTAAGRKSPIAAAVFFAIALLENFWPAISDLFREIIRWIHAH